jgi:hypothetical protein
MPRNRPANALALFAAALLLFLAPAGAPLSQEEIRRVFVTNFPPTQQVAGTVSIDGVVRHAALQRLKDLQVPPVGPKETTRLIQAGTLATDGFTAMVLALNGQTRGRILRAGAVGALLIPDEEPVTRAFEEEGLTQFPIEIAASSVSGRSLYFASEPQRHILGFPRYRVLLYNTTDKSATVNLYAYLTY